MTEHVSNQRAKTVGVDIAHVSRLKNVDQLRARQEAMEFLGRMKRYVDEAYLHLDVKEHKEQAQGIPAFHWRALLITDRGRYHAEDAEIGAVESLKQVFDQLETQINSRIGRLAT